MCLTPRPAQLSTSESLELTVKVVVPLAFAVVNLASSVLYRVAAQQPLCPATKAGWWCALFWCGVVEWCAMMWIIYTVLALAFLVRKRSDAHKKRVPT